MIRIERFTMLGREVTGHCCNPADEVYLYKSINTKTNYYLNVVMSKIEVDSGIISDKEIRKRIRTCHRDVRFCPNCKNSVARIGRKLWACPHQTCNLYDKVLADFEVLKTLKEKKQ